MSNIKIKTYDSNEPVLLSDFLKTKSPSIKYRVGCDSLNVRDKTIYITVLVGVHPNNSGAFIVYLKDKVPKIEDMYRRLWYEVEKAISFASLLRESFNIDIEAVDLDLNSDPQHRSNKLLNSAIGYATSCGFPAFYKPQNVAAIYAADHLVHRKR
jgi:predicted RNase H-related nuclease YkuK (DUF458 family)